MGKGIVPVAGLSCEVTFLPSPCYGRVSTSVINGFKSLLVMKLDETDSCRELRGGAWLGLKARVLGWALCNPPKRSLTPCEGELETRIFIFSRNMCKMAVEIAVRI